MYQPELFDYIMIFHTREGKSSKMSKPKFMFGVECSQSYVYEIPKNRQLSLILPNLQTQNKLLSLIHTFKFGF